MLFRSHCRHSDVPRFRAFRCGSKTPTSCFSLCISMVVLVTGVLLELCCERKKKALSSLLYARNGDWPERLQVMPGVPLYRQGPGGYNAAQARRSLPGDRGWEAGAKLVEHRASPQVPSPTVLPLKAPVVAGPGSPRGCHVHERVFGPGP